MRALACPASLKGVLSASAAADALVEGLRAAGAAADALPLSDGGEGLLDALGGDRRAVEVQGPLGGVVRAEWALREDGTAVVESAQAIGLPLVPPHARDPLRASSRGLGELIRAAVDAGAQRLVVGLGGSATVDGGAGLLAVLHELPVPTVVACDVTTTLHDAARLYGPQKGATPEQVAELERRLAALERLAPYAGLPGAGAAGGLGAALASLGGELRPGAELVLAAVGFDPAPYDLVVTGEGRVDRTTAEGKAPAVVARRCREAGVRCVVFGGVVEEAPANVETRPLSGDPARAREDLRELGALLGGAELAGERLQQLPRDL